MGLNITRRSLLRKSGIVALGGVGLSGCSTEQTPPPRKSEVFEQIEYDEEDTQLEVRLEKDPTVESRLSPGESNSDALSFSSLSPIGVASAKATGRGRVPSSSVNARGSHGRAKWRGGAYGAWRSNHSDEVREFQARIQWVGLGYLGDTDEYRQNAPPAGPVNWSEKSTDASSEDLLRYDLPQTGWYRLGANLRGPGERRFGVEAVDFRYSEEEILSMWKISPRL